MARARAKYCGMKTEMPDVEQRSTSGDSGFRRVVTWCGDKAYMSHSDRAASLRLVTCPKCSAAIGKARLAKIGRGVRLERMAEPLLYDRSSYALWIDDVHRGTVTIANGWGKQWALHTLSDEMYGARGRCISGEAPDRWRAKSALDRNEALDFWPVHYGSKEAMAVAAVAMCDAGKLPTADETIARKAARDEAERIASIERADMRAQQAKENERLELERIERRDVWLEALASLEARSDLTNLERAGLEAIKKLYR